MGTASSVTGRLWTVEITKLCMFTPKSITSQNLEGQYVTALFCISSELQLTFSELPKTGGKTGGIGDGTEGHGQALHVLHLCRHKASQAQTATRSAGPARHQAHAVGLGCHHHSGWRRHGHSPQYCETSLHRDGLGQVPNTRLPCACPVLGA